MRSFGVLLALILIALGGCRPSASKTLPIQDASAKSIDGAFGKSLGERWPDVTCFDTKQCEAWVYDTGVGAGGIGRG